MIPSTERITGYFQEIVARTGFYSIQVITLGMEMNNWHNVIVIFFLSGGLVLNCKTHLMIIIYLSIIIIFLMGCCTSSVRVSFSARSRRNQKGGLKWLKTSRHFSFLWKPRAPVNKPCPSRKSGTTLSDASPTPGLSLISKSTCGGGGIIMWSLSSCFRRTVHCLKWVRSSLTLVEL